MIWLSSDQHFFHNNIIRFCNRPFKNLDEMHETMIKNWNQRVKSKERAYILGDFLFGGLTRLEKIIPRLNGEITLIRGNHDNASTRHYIELGFKDVRENELITLQKQGGEKVQVLLSHFPYYPIQKYTKLHKAGGSTYINLKLQDNYDIRYPHKRIVDTGEYWLIHGHVHQAWKVLGRQINVGVDVHDFKPVSHHKILEIIERSGL